MELNELRKIAEAATSGLWECVEGDEAFGVRASVGSLTWDDHSGEVFKKEDAEHIATFNPETVLALLSRVEKAERSCRLLGTIIERDGKNLVELTNSQDIIPEYGDGDWEVVWERAQEMKARLEQAEQAVQRVREVAESSDDKHLTMAILEALDADTRRLADDALHARTTKNGDARG